MVQFDNNKITLGLDNEIRDNILHLDIITNVPGYGPGVFKMTKNQIVILRDHLTMVLERDEVKNNSPTTAR